MHGYPEATVTQLQLSPTILEQLEQRLHLIYLGKPHKSSQIHELVIRELEEVGPSAPQLVPLRETAVAAANNIQAGDFTAFGHSMIKNNEAQRNLNPALISPDADQIIKVCQSFGATGWKVNGAGGNGGSITLLGSEDYAKNQQMCRAITQLNPSFTQLPIKLSAEGVTVWESAATGN